MTDDVMTEQEIEQLTRRLLEISSAVGYEITAAIAKSLVKADPGKVKVLVQEHERGQEQQAELARSRERLRTASLG